MTIGTQGKETKVKTTIMIGTKNTAEKGIVIGDARMIVKRRVMHMFQLAVVTVQG